MKPGLFVLPFLALLAAAIGVALKSVFPEMGVFHWAGWLVAAGLVVLWVVLDFENFKHLFSRKGTKYGASSGLTVVLGLLVIVGLAFFSATGQV